MITLQQQKQQQQQQCSSRDPPRLGSIEVCVHLINVETWTLDLIQYRGDLQYRGKFDTGANSIPWLHRIKGAQLFSSNSHMRHVPANTSTLTHRDPKVARAG